MSKFTKGPWKVDKRVGCIAVYPEGIVHSCLSGTEQSFIHYKNGYREFDKKGAFVEWQVDEEAIANAHLISAAPELYNTLDAIVKKIAKDGNVKVTASDEFQNAVKALAKADGDNQ